jgi:hypothetical protein
MNEEGKVVEDVKGETGKAESAEEVEEGGKDHGRHEERKGVENMDNAREGDKEEGEERKEWGGNKEEGEQRGKERGGRGRRREESVV